MIADQTDVYRRLRRLEDLLERGRVEVPRSTRPRCIKTMGSGNFLTNVGNAAVNFPLNTAEADNDSMGLVSARITIRTPGRYVIVGKGMVYQGNGAGNWGICPVKGVGQFDGTTSVTPFENAYTNGAVYSGSNFVIVDDLVVGDFVYMQGITWTAGLTVNFHYNDTWLGAWMV